MSDEARLRWRCRRGTREMDLLLESFLDECYARLSEDQQGAFARLLEESDMDIINWVTGRSQPEDQGYHDIITTLQSMMKR